MAGHRLGVLLWICVCVLDGVAGSCPAGRYGYRCSYQCHCPQVNCNPTSGCYPISCSRGWSGPTCQKQNIALNKTTSASGVFWASSNAVDGDKGGVNNAGSCFHSANDNNSITSAWWRVDLGQKTLVHDVIIYFRTDVKVRRNGVQIYIADTVASPTDGVNCYNVTGNSDGTDIPDVLNVTCSGEGRYLVLYTTTVNNEKNVPVMDFCEVEVNVCGPGTFGADCDNYCHCDGDVCNYITGVCPSGVCLPGWHQETCHTACGPGTFDTNCNNSCHCDGETCDRVTGVCSSGVCVPGWQTETCGTACDAGSFGTNCNNTCHCDGETCNHTTGVCPSGVCLPGWQTETCDTECNAGSYGANCAETCSSRNCKGDNSSCDLMAGECAEGCKTGWYGTDCTQACDPGTFGTNCSNSCYCDGETCDHVTGVCPSRVCLPGWQTERCNTVCKSSSYGTNCSRSCSQRNCKGETSVCNHVTGACLGGCQSGWSGADCVQTNNVETAVLIGSTVGSVVAATAVAVLVVVVFLRRQRSQPTQSGDCTDMLEIDKVEMALEEGADNSVQVVEDEAGEDNNDTYYNIGMDPAVTVVAVHQLGELIKELQASVGGFQAEFQRLPTTFTQPYNVAKLEENKGKNKYISYYPYDATRVVLQELPDQPGSDYINASYIDGYSQAKVYIAAQAPTTKTLTDFWRMIWEQNCTRVVMVTHLAELGRVKCEAYWSDASDMHVGDFIISVTESSIRAHWAFRELQVTDRKENTTRCISHFHFTTWPDHGTPEEMALTEFLWLVRTSRNTQDDPLLVHCSAGVGRTGTYIALDYLLDQALAEDAVDVFGCVSGMRDQRKGMIQTKEQYTCVYMALYETLQFGNTVIGVEEFRRSRDIEGTFSTGRMAITEFIETVNTQRKAQSQGTSMRGRVWINGRSDILAVSLRSHLSMNGYLLTEAPSVTTASLFWKLTEEQESSTVIVLPDSHQSLSSFVPTPGDSLDLGPVTVRCSTEVPVNTDITLLNVHRQMENVPSTPVRVYILNILPVGSPSTFLELLEQIDQHTGDVSPNTVTVIYSDGGRQNAAMLCILRNIVQGLKYDKRAEIYNNMRAVGHCLDQDITAADVALCYDVAAAYLESQNIYANT